MYISKSIDDQQMPPQRFYSPYLGEAPAEGTQVLDPAVFLERVLQAHVAQSIKRRGQPRPDLSPAQLAPVAGTPIQMRADAAAAASRMIGAANQDLARASSAGDADVQKTVGISATSGYRSSAHQERLWREYFRTRYYPETVGARSHLQGGAHGEAAVQHMVKYIAPKIAAPGFSNHQAGIAIDLWQRRTPGNEIRNSTSTRPINWPERWRQTWFFHWLQENAARFHFHPYEKEPWHWEYRPSAEFPAPK